MYKCVCGGGCWWGGRECISVCVWGGDAGGGGGGSGR